MTKITDNKIFCIKNYYYQLKLIFEENKLYNFRYETVLEPTHSYPKNDNTTKIWIEYYDDNHIKKEHNFFIIENKFVNRNFNDYFCTLKDSRKIKLEQLQNTIIKDNSQTNN